MNLKSDPNQINNKAFIKIHHIGGRGGGVNTFPLPNQFNNEILNVIYDADESCIDHIRDQWINKKVLVMPYCLSNENGKAMFNLNYDPYSNSLFKLNSDYGHYYHSGHDKDTDYLNSGAMKTIETININTKKLDTLVQDNLVPLPDVLLMSCAGAESNILEGSDECLKNSVVAVTTRVHFADVRQDGPLFGDIDQLMKKNNFMLVNIEPHYTGYLRISKNCRGSGVPLSGNAIYLIKPSFVTGENNLEISVKLEKLALMALTYGYTEIAYDAINRSLKIEPTVEKKNLCQEFIYKFYYEVKKYKNLPILWHDRWSHEKIKERTKSKKLDTSSRLKAHAEKFKNSPFKHTLIILFKILSKLFLKLKVLFSKLINIFGINIEFIPQTTKFEKFLLDNGFNNAVDQIKNRRKGYLKTKIN